MSEELTEALDRYKEAEASLKRTQEDGPRKARASLSRFFGGLLNGSVEVSRLVLEAARNVVVISAITFVSVKLNLPWLFSFSTWLWLALLIFISAQIVILLERAGKLISNELISLDINADFDRFIIFRVILFVVVTVTISKTVNYYLADVFQAMLESSARTF